jgi:exodeoxyribonuclease X
MLTFLVIDTETTGTEVHDQVVELGYCETSLDESIDYDSMLVKPTIPITPGASAVHHFIDADLVDAHPLGEAAEILKLTCSRWADAVAYVAHNAPFDRSRLPMFADKPWLDTLRMARRYLPDAPGHSNQVLRYYLKLHVPRELPAHRTLCDCLTTAALLRHLLAGPARDDFERLGVAEFAKFVDGPLLLTTCNFGKHAGKPWPLVPPDYLEWILRQKDFDPDVRFTASHYLDLSRKIFE